MIVRPYWLYLVTHWSTVAVLSLVVGALEVVARARGD